ncbi:peptidoglycan DD-metalloendopeptidase family protein [Ideonella sp.]|uniref:peptidoglycan DD-metalloendopeptidase family protein n=1 Tax=Ideonella sp. TaxID=1929293 RepID=UPI003BB67664
MVSLFSRRSAAWLSLLAFAALAGCANPKVKAPVEERGAGTVSSPSKPAARPVPPSTGAEARPGTYTVKPGDTLMRIGLETGQSWRDLARWNGMDNPNLIEVGQVLRVTAPTAEAGAVATRPVNAPAVESRPLESKAASSAASATGAGSAASGTVAASAPAAPRESEDEIAWAWPAAGSVLSGFDESRSKGLAIAGKAGDPVLAAADGRVVYAGSGLRGYGNLIIVKHNATYLTAYAHNQSLLVKEDQAVRKGQKIAEMGSSDADRVQLHFEIRRQGKPIDPARLLPAR